ncbi:AAA family ATPase [Marinibactrum halimedae]|uniref:ATPase AAA n=1 Tax=Marinibactrum halimedae TaxID=1444977 RepID=A0AA37WNZ4_9GAMM|nr:AAA family ATPase [Marinibactrum halimedae]MCD9460765.1 AAA family ATPase [Marinibactrum halimedae]GLS26661.1 ATPase AAA [Marinibactrum halimedae]
MEKTVERLVAEISRVVLGKDTQIRLALACLFSRGHLLIEDQPGMGKTTLAQSLAKVLGLEYNRVQFTSDLLPADIIGVSIFDRDTNGFRFHQGPVFSQLLLADEINRTTPKTQSALLEAMEERQVSAEGVTHTLPKPFFVIATQNPSTQDGTFALPESQLDRFLMRISLGYPDNRAERALLEGRDPRERIDQLQTLITPDDFDDIIEQAEQVQASSTLLDYLQRLIAYTRNAPEFSYGLSTRGALSLMRCAKTWALMHGRHHVIPEDLQELLPSVVAHRVRDAADYSGQSGYGLVERVLEQVDVVG